MNDQFAVVMRQGDPSVHVVRDLAKEQELSIAALTPTGSWTGGMSSIRTAENTSAAVALESTFKTDYGVPVTMRFRLSAGAFFLDVRSQDGGQLMMELPPAYVVVPDYFGDDLVYDPLEDSSRRPIALPTENSLLALTNGGQEILACVWSSPVQKVRLHSTGERLTPGATIIQIEMPAGKSAYLAYFTGKDIWHVSALYAKDRGDNVALDWKPPFDARWRASLPVMDESAQSWNFADSAETGAKATTLTGAKEDRGACWFAAGQANIRMFYPPRMALDGKLVIYPIDRARTTPLTTYCLTDLMRDTLGVGPCQYVLDAEGMGLKGAAQAATPEQVTRWVEKQFAKKPSRREVDGINERLDAMDAQMQATRVRISRYRDFARLVRSICNQAQAADKTGLAGQILDIASGMEATADLADIAEGPRTVRVQAMRVRNMADKDDALELTRDALAAIRSAGARQDYDLARLRMAVRRIGVLLPPGNNDASSFLADVRREIQKLAPNKPATMPSQPAAPK